MDTVKEDIKVLEDFTTKKAGNEVQFSKYCSSFLFTTENQEGINSIIDYKDKSVITVAASADQYVSAIYYGAKSCDMFDINKFTFYISCLKIAAIKGLSYEEFMKFMIPMSGDMRNIHFWDLRMFKKIMGYMPNDAAYFWENAIYLFRKNGYGNFICPGHKHSKKENVLRGMPFYANEEEFYKLKSMLSKKEFPKFYFRDVCNLSELVKDEYDIVYLSNIIECMVCEEVSSYAPFYHVNEDSVELDKITMVSREVMKMLKSDGTLLMSYRPNTNLDYSRDLLYNNDYFEAKTVPCKILPTGNESYGRDLDTDIVLTYRPSKKGNFLV